MKIKREKIIKIVNKYKNLHYYRGQLNQLEKGAPYTDSKYVKARRVSLLNTLKKLGDKVSKEELNTGEVKAQYIERRK